MFVLRHLPARFKARSALSGANLALRALAIATHRRCHTMFLFTITAVADPHGRTGRRSSSPRVELSPEADGSNVVNVTLVDFRGFDTLGEALVLVVAAGLGVVSLVRAKPWLTNGDDDADAEHGRPWRTRRG